MECRDQYFILWLIWIPSLRPFKQPQNEEWPSNKSSTFLKLSLVSFYNGVAMTILKQSIVYLLRLYFSNIKCRPEICRLISFKIRLLVGFPLPFNFLIFKNNDKFKISMATPHLIHSMSYHFVIQGLIGIIEFARSRILRFLWVWFLNSNHSKNTKFQRQTCQKCLKLFVFTSCCHCIISTCCGSLDDRTYKFLPTICCCRSLNVIAEYKLKQIGQHGG